MAPPLESRKKPGVARLDLEKLYATRQVGGACWAPDGRRIAFLTNITGRMNLWTMPAEGGWPVQLTVSEQRQAAAAWSPDGRHIAYQSDYDGNEQWDLFLVSVENGEVVNLTNTPEISEEGPVWSPDGRRLAYSAKPKASSVYEIFILDMETGERRQVTHGTPPELSNRGPRWSADGARIAYTQSHAAGKDSNIFVVDPESGESALLTPHQGEKLYRAAAWSPEGAKLLIESNAGEGAAAGYDNVALLECATGRITWLTRETAEVSAGGWSADGRHICWAANRDGNFEIFLFRVDKAETVQLDLPPGINTLGRADSIFSPDGTRLLHYYSGPDRPNDIWVYDLRSETSRQVSNSLVGGLRSEDMVEPYLVRYSSFDGREIPAFLYIPFNLQMQPVHPAVVYVHGGPAAQSVNGFVRPVQYLVNNGYIVIAPNYRGSSGYGKEFLDLNRMDMGGGDLQDVVHAARFLKTIGYVDPSRVALMGGSYGGYLTMMGLTKTPELWAAGVAIVPFVNWFTEVANEDPILQQYDLANMGDPVENKALWEDRSPINFIHRVRAPVLILAGANDPRCPQSESDQVVAAIRARGGVVEYQAYENEGHGFARRENQIDSFRRIAVFLGRYLRG